MVFRTAADSTRSFPLTLSMALESGDGPMALPWLLHTLELRSTCRKNRSLQSVPSTRTMVHREVCAARSLPASRVEVCPRVQGRAHLS
eukprot:scaffold73052_cov103-Phaeocystis_antarctica.AAC.9